MGANREDGKPSVLVMMATYNGEIYLKEQIDSILAQRGVNVTLWIRDDRSTDGTASLLRNYARSDSRVSFKVNARNLGVGLNFMQMVYEVKAKEFDYFAFADQDDVWLPDKLETAVQTMKSYITIGSNRHLNGVGMPILYCSELLNVDRDLSHPTPELQRMPHVEEFPASLLIRNIFSGCTMVFNRDHLKLAQIYKMDEFPRIHDTWMILLAYYCGNLKVDRRHAKILRRITGENTAGATVPGADVRRAMLSALNRPSKQPATKTARQLLMYSSFMTAEDRAVVESFVSYADTISSRIRWAVSGNYRSLSMFDTLLARLKFLLARY